MHLKWDMGDIKKKKEIQIEILEIKTAMSEM